MAAQFKDPLDAYRYYSSRLSQYIPPPKPPTAIDPSNLIKGVQPVLQQEERRSQQQAAAQFAKMGMPVSSAYMERLGRIGGETSAKLADITNRYMFDAARENARYQWDAEMQRYQQQMDLFNRLLSEPDAFGISMKNAQNNQAGPSNALDHCIANARSPKEMGECYNQYQEGISGPEKLDALERCRQAAASPEDLAECEIRYRDALLNADRNPVERCIAKAKTPQEMAWCELSYRRQLDDYEQSRTRSQLEQAFGGPWFRPPGGQRVPPWR